MPQDRSYVAPFVTADRGRVHLEARYNYENLETGSFWLGRNYSFGRKVAVEVTPLIGGVIGQSNGVAPGYLASMSFRRFSIDSQGEYLFDVNSSLSFFYNWTEVSYSLKWFRTGVAIQRTKTYQTDLELQRGMFAGASYKNMDFTVYEMNLAWEKPTWILALDVHF